MAINLSTKSDLEKANQKADAIINVLLKEGETGFSDTTCQYAREILKTVIIQMMTSQGDSKVVTDILDNLPVYEIGEFDISSVKKDANISESQEFFNNQILELLSKLDDGLFKYFFTEYFSGINNLYVYFIPTQYDGIYEFRAYYSHNNGDDCDFESNVYYDTKTKEIYGKNNDGIFSIGYNYNAKHFLVTNPQNVWMRKFGYNVFYDILGQTIFMDCDIKRIKFNYNGKDWMIQLWKGNYTKLTNGCEIGIYYKKKDSLLLYDCAEDKDMLEMSLALYNNDEVLFERKSTLHWWMSGFKAGKAINHNDLVLKSTIKFKNSEMTDAFINAVNSSKDKNFTCTRNNNSVSIIWK